MKTLLSLILMVTCSLAYFVESDKIEHEKIKRLIHQEEMVAKAIKRYIIATGKIPSNIQKLVDTSHLASKGLGLLSNGEEILIDQDDLSLTSRRNFDGVRSILLNDYFSNRFREHTIVPINQFSSKNGNGIKLKLSRYEKMVLEVINSQKSSSIKKYGHLQGTINYYANNQRVFTLYEDHIVVFVDIMDESIWNQYQEEINKRIYAGQTIYVDTNEGLSKFQINSSTNTPDPIVEENKPVTKPVVGKSIVQFTRRGGGIIINGDVLTWGNNQRFITSIPKNSSTFGSVDLKDNNNNPVFNVPLRVRVYTENKKYSSIDRVKFKEFSADVFHGTCAVSMSGELYCNGPKMLDHTGTTYKENGVNVSAFENYSGSASDDKSLLYKHRYFDESRKLVKIFGLMNVWLAFDEEGRLYYWGESNSRGFFGIGSKEERDEDNKKYYPPLEELDNMSASQPNDPAKPKVNWFFYDGETNMNQARKVIDLEYTLAVPHRRIAALTKSGTVFIWGADNGYLKNKSQECLQKVGLIKEDLCEPLKVESSIKFSSIRGGQRAFIATDSSGDHYRISQAKGESAVVEKVKDLISFDESEDKAILSVDLSSRVFGSQFSEGEGIVWVNANNELKGDYFTLANQNDEFFKQAIQRISWKKIRVLEDENGICGIDVNNQMYCWGFMSYFSKHNSSYMMPVFNANLHDENKDYMFAIAGNKELSDNYLTKMTSGTWMAEDSSGKESFFIRYPTYIGGFNYDFEFK